MPPTLPGPLIALHPVSSAGQIVLEIAMVVAIAALVAVAIRIRRRWGTSMGFVVLLATLFGSGVEVIYNTAANFWYYQPHQEALFSTWGRSVPVWALASYLPFYGGLGMLGWWLIERGATRARVAAYAVGIWVYAVVTEVVLVGIHVYTYFGPQPYRIAGFPVWTAAANAAICTLVAIGAARLSRVTSGPRQWLLIAAGPPLTSSCLIGTTFPMVSVLHAAHPSTLALYLAGAAATVLAALVIVLAVGLMIPRDGLADSLIPESVAARRPEKLADMSG